MSQYSKQLHDNYKRSILAFSENYKKMDDEAINQIDSFCRMSALYLWGSFDVSEDECVCALPEIYTKDKPDYSREEVAKILSVVKKKKASIKVPGFFRDIVSDDKEYGAYYSRVFIDGMQYILLMFTLIDENTTIEEVQAVTAVIEMLNDYCDEQNIKECSGISDLNSFITPQKENKNVEAIEHKTPATDQKEKNIDSRCAMEKLSRLIGLKNVKEEITAIVNFAKVQNMRKSMNLPVTKVSYHLVFTGNPGTGKTTVARLVAEIYKDLGLISRGHLTETDRGDLVAGYVGQTAIKTKEIIEKAMGGVLFIDEAYSLTNKDDQGYGQEAIDTLLKEMEDHRDDFVVIAAGYDGLMEDFINSNPGLQSRFTHYVHFDDYTGDELYGIFEQFCSSNKYELSEDANEPLKKYFKKLADKHGNNFGNAREVRNFFENAISKQANRISSSSDISKEEIVTIKAVDLDINDDEEIQTLEAALDELNALTGLDNVKKEVEGLVQLVKYQQIRKNQGLKVPSVSLHLVFTGNPGTGKTTVARCVSKIYKCLGLISDGQLIETDRSGLVAGFVGQTAIKTKAVIDKAIGGVLFIDEAYTLLGSDNDFGQEAIDTLLKEMEDHRDNLVVIAAGYTDEMSSFIHSNPGLESRFNRYINFEDYSAEDLTAIFKSLCEKNQYKLAEDAEEIIRMYFEGISPGSIGNGRGVRNIFEKVITHQANNFDVADIENVDMLSTISKDDISAVIQIGR